MLNKAILQGRLVSDPELRKTQNGTAVLAFRIASDRDVKSKSANAQNTDFINVVAWRQTAEFIAKYFRRGEMILIDGRIQTRDYTDQNGQRRYITEVLAETVNFAGSKCESGGGAPAGGYAQANNYGAPSYGGNTYGANSYGGGYSAPQAQPSYIAPASYAPSSAGQAPVNEFAELNDDDGELPF